MHKDIAEVLFTNEQIKARIKAMAKEISDVYGDEEVLVVGVLKGVAYFMMELTQAMTCPTEIDFMMASSYGNSSISSGDIRIGLDIHREITGKNVLLLDDILDTGLTLQKIVSILKLRNPKSIRVGVMMDKKERRLADCPADFVGFNIPNEFVVGFGLDYAEKYRNLDFVGVLKPEVYAK